MTRLPDLEKPRILIGLHRTAGSFDHTRIPEIFAPTGAELVIATTQGTSQAAWDDLFQQMLDNQFSGSAWFGTSVFDPSIPTPEYEEAKGIMTPFIHHAVDTGTDIYTECASTQTAVDILKGKIGADPAQAETETVRLVLNETGQKDIFFQGFDKKNLVPAVHKISVLELPCEAVLLGSTTAGDRVKNINAAMRVNKGVLVQPHVAYTSEFVAGEIGPTNERLSRSPLGQYTGTFQFPKSDKTELLLVNWANRLPSKGEIFSRPRPKTFR